MMSDSNNFETVLDKIIPSFQRYYSISKENIEPPFICEAEFKSHTEQYFLVKAAKLANIDSNEYVYFASEKNLDLEKLENFCGTAWKKGLEKIHPYSGHRNSDVTLIILTNNVEKQTINNIKKTKYYKSYKFGFYGWSSFRLAVLDIASKTVYSNSKGSDLKKLLKTAIQTA